MQLLISVAGWRGFVFFAGRPNLLNLLVLFLFSQLPEPTQFLALDAALNRHRDDERNLLIVGDSGAGASHIGSP